MALTDWTLDELRDRLREEFGIEDVAAQNNIIDKRINDAVTAIVRRRPNWPWMRKRHTIDTGPAITSFATFKTGSRTSETNGFTPIVRKIITKEDSGNLPTTGFVIEAWSSPDITLDAQDLATITELTVTDATNATPIVVTTSTTHGLTTGDRVTVRGVVGNTAANVTTNLITVLTTTTLSLDGTVGNGAYVSGGTVRKAVAVRMIEGMFQLPDDFVRLDGPPVFSGAIPNVNILTYLDPVVFQKKRYAQVPAVLHDQFYTVIRDPLDLEERKYLLIYPYVAARRVLRLFYFRDVPKLVADNDVPIIPRSDRMVIFYWAAWLIATKENEEAAAAYRDAAFLELERMTNEYDLVDDPDTNDDKWREPDFVVPPPGYEDFAR